ncbi:MAG: hypothetical protein Q9197_000542 [Variospora fuerteventurae]
MVLVFSCLIPGTEAAAKGAAVGLFTYIASFGATWLPLPWLYPAEINPIKTRQKANALSTCSNWLFNFLIVMITPIMISNIGWATYLFFAVVNACFLPVIYYTYPETKRRSLEEIDIIFAKGWLQQGREEEVVVGGWGFWKGDRYVRAARELPLLTDEEVEVEARKQGIVKDGDGGEGLRVRSVRVEEGKELVVEKF